MSRKSAIVCLSGGMDSASLLPCAISRFDRVYPVSFTYGSKHSPYEIACAKQLSQHYGLHHYIVDFSSVMTNIQSALLATSRRDIPEGHYESATMKETVVPGRNFIFAAILTGIAQSQGVNTIFMGIHAGDHAIYPDCRPEFAKAINEVALQVSEGQVNIEAPFLHQNKKQILEYGIPAGVPYHMTRTCYKNQAVACGKCGACQERLEAFRALGIVDPIDYETCEASF